MNWRKVGTLLALGVLCAPAAHAGWYVSVFAGLNDVDDTTIATGLGTLDSSYDSGVTWGIAGGYEFQRFRLEGEILSERENDVDVHRLDGVDQQGSVGTLENEVGIGNILYDFRREARVSPYVGVGVGVAEVTASDYGFVGLPETFAEDNVLAYQAIVGLGIELSPAGRSSSTPGTMRRKMRSSISRARPARSRTAPSTSPPVFAIPSRICLGEGYGHCVPASDRGPRSPG